MQGQYDLFSTNPGTSGYRLNYLEIYNWGTFHNTIYRIAPQGNNSLLTGANASGKSTLIDALLTLLVPFKKDRFYNQSSGNEKKGDRTEETYVLGNYGNIQSEGEIATTTQRLRDKNTYSIILASFENNYDKVVTLFQVRWFVGNELKCAYGISSMSITIKEDFSKFDGSNGDWKRTLEKKYNSNVQKKRIEFFDTIRDYRDRIVNALGLRSDKALTLFNQVVGVKVLNDLDDFVRNNMLEQRDAESEYASLYASFSTLIEAKTKIEKVKEQIAQLEPIDEKAKELELLNEIIDNINNNRQMALYWFALKNVELAGVKKQDLENKLKILNKQLAELNNKKDNLRREENQLISAINNDEIGKQITELGKEIDELKIQKEIRLEKLDDYNTKAREVGFSENPSEDVFLSNRGNAYASKEKCKRDIAGNNEELRLAKNKQEQIKKEIDDNIIILEQLKKNKNNISVDVARIRESILNAVGATSTEIPFIGELIRVKESERIWENSIEKILHNLALRLIVPEKYYRTVSEFVNSHNLQGRIVYQRLDKSSALRGFQPMPDNCLFNKVEFNTNSPYSEWVEDLIYDQYNYACVSDINEFYQYKEKAVTKEGLIKSVQNRHEKDDRQHVNSRTNYVLGWDNKEKIASLVNYGLELQDQQKQIVNNIRGLDKKSKELSDLEEAFGDLFKLFPKYEDIYWEEIAQAIQSKTEKKQVLEATNDKVKTLKDQLDQVQSSLKTLEEETIKHKNSEIFQVEKVDMPEAKKRYDDNVKIISLTGEIDVSDFEDENSEWLDVDYETIEAKRNDFQEHIKQKEATAKENKSRYEREAASLIRRFKYPSDDITTKFVDWRSDVLALPEADNIHLIGEYQNLYERLKKEDLVRFEKKFDEYLQETVTNKVADFRMFFIKWKNSIKDTIDMLNKSLKEICFNPNPTTYIKISNTQRISKDVYEFGQKLENAIPNYHEINNTQEGKRRHFETKIQPLIDSLSKDEQWRKRVMDVRNWFSYKVEEFFKETDQKRNTYESMGQLSGGEKAQLTYTILGSAIAYQFGLTKDGLQSNSFRFIAIDEAFKAQDEDKARYLISLCNQLHLQLLVVTPSDNIHIVENDISFVHYVERHGNESRLFNMPIEVFKEEREKFLANDNTN